MVAPAMHRGGHWPADSEWRRSNFGSLSGARPQAVAWERLGEGTVRVVARYARMLLAVEKPNAPAKLSNEVRQLEDRLGLNPPSMQRLRWEIVADELEESRERTAPKLRSVKAVDHPVVKSIQAEGDEPAHG